MILAISLRSMEMPEDPIWLVKRYVCDHYKKIFDSLDVVLFPVLSDHCADAVCRICDGLILPGSEKNVHPDHYGHSRLLEMAHTYTVDEYSADAQLVEAFAKAGKPILGICAGLQVINVFFGGTLNQLIPNHNNIHGGHKLRLEKDSFVHSVYGKEEVEVNSYHRQCAQEVAPGFRVTARAEDGTVEAIERGNIIAVQWHPEVAPEMDLFRGFLKAFFET